ncbi:MAG: hypothetical protein H6707_06295 [Deltaproteobacteria bacterium]|nr:hypothetical protein [Deltaproteobacteria bacterium]
MRYRSFFAAVLCTLLGIPTANADAQIPCLPVEKGVIQLDGVLNDWGNTQVSEFAGPAISVGRAAWSGAADLSLSVRCNHDQRYLYLGLAVRDEYVVRLASKRAEDDQVRLRFGHKILTIRPTDFKKIKTETRWGNATRFAGAVIAEGLLDDGYALELQLPLSALPGYRKGIAELPITFEVLDCDAKARMRHETTLSARSQVVFAAAAAHLKAFLSDKGYRASQIRKRLEADVVGKSGVETVVLVGRTVGIIGDELPTGGYFYLDLQVRKPTDIHEIKLVDLNGDKKAELLVSYIENAHNGYRKLLAVYRFDSSDKFVRPLTVELQKGQGAKWIKNRFRLQPGKGKRKAAGQDLVFDQPSAHGYDQGTFHEAPATDAFPILLPWGNGAKKRAIRFEGDEFFEL